MVSRLIGLLVAGDVVAVVVVSAVIGPPVAVSQVVVLAITATGWAHAGLYRLRYSLSVLDDLPRLAGAIIAATGITAVVSWLVGVPGDPAVVFALGLGVGVPTARAVTYAVARSLRIHGVLVQQVIIAGTDPVGQRLAHDLDAHPEYGLRVIAILDGPIPPSWAPTADVDALILTDGSSGGRELRDRLHRFAERGCDVYVVPHGIELHQPGGGDDHVWRVSLNRLRQPAFHRLSWRGKRMLDRLLAGLALVLLAPLLLITALAVRVGVGSPVIFRQERVGRGGRQFTVLKFRSLHPANDNESRTRWSIANDQRLGRVGRIIRATSLDELPQLVNVLRGEMSLVGPRPERLLFAQRFAREFPRYNDRHRVPGGITGWAAVNGLRGDTSIEERADFDNFYIDNWSLWMDIKIMVRTIPALMRRVEPSATPAPADANTEAAVLLPGPRSARKEGKGASDELYVARHTANHRPA